MKIYLTAVLSFLFIAAFGQPYLAGDRVDVYATDGKYYAATVLEASNKQYKVRYLGFTADSDAWASEDNIVRGAAIGDRVVVSSQNAQVFYGTVENISANTYQVKYDGYADVYSLTRNQFAIVSSVAESRKNSLKNTAAVNPVVAQPAEQVIQTTETRPAATGSTHYQPGTKLLGLEGTTWYAATVLEFRNGKYRVKWDDYSSEAELTPEQVKLKPTLPADKARAVNGKLYLRSLRSVLSGYTDLEWFFLGDNGVIILNPMFGTNPINPSLEQTQNFNKVGLYTIGKKSLDVAWLNGYKTSYPLEMSKGEIESLDGGVMVRQNGLPDNLKLNGTYDGTMFFGSIRSSSTTLLVRMGV